MDEIKIEEHYLPLDPDEIKTEDIVVKEEIDVELDDECKYNSYLFVIWKYFFSSRFNFETGLRPYFFVYLYYYSLWILSVLAFFSVD